MARGAWHVAARTLRILNVTKFKFAQSALLMRPDSKFAFDVRSM